MSYFVIALCAAHPDAPPVPDFMYWGGYTSVGRTHAWTRGVRGRIMAVRFYARSDALLAGVSGPNVPNCRPKDQPQFWEDRGIQVLEIHTDPEIHTGPEIPAG